MPKGAPKAVTKAVIKAAPLLPPPIFDSALLRIPSLTNYRA